MLLHCTNCYISSSHFSFSRYIQRLFIVLFIVIYIYHSQFRVHHSPFFTFQQQFVGNLCLWLKVIIFLRLSYLLLLLTTVNYTHNATWFYLFHSYISFHHLHRKTFQVSLHFGNQFFGRITPHLCASNKTLRHFTILFTIPNNDCQPLLDAIAKPL